MFNNALFILSIFLITTSAWGFLRMGKSALISWFVFVNLIANIFVIKQIELFHFNATASDIFTVGGLFGLNLLQERYGSKAANQAIWASLGCQLFFIVISQIHLMYIPSELDKSQAIFEGLFSHSPRIIMASLFTAFIVQHFDSFFYGKLRQCFPKRSIIIISTFSIFISQLLDTGLFTVLGLYGIMPALLEIFIFSYLIKCFCIICLPFIATLSQKIMRYD